MQLPLYSFDNLIFQIVLKTQHNYFNLEVSKKVKGVVLGLYSGCVTVPTHFEAKNKHTFKLHYKGTQLKPVLLFDTSNDLFLHFKIFNFEKTSNKVQFVEG